MLLLTGATGTASARPCCARLTARGDAGALPGARSRGGWAPSACGCRSRSATSPTRRPFATRCAACDTVVHLAASARDQPRGSIEELNGARHLAAGAGRRAGRACAQFVFFSRARRLAARTASRFLRAKALAEQRRDASPRCPTRSSRRSIIYAPGDPWLTLLERLRCCRSCRARRRARPFQPIWAEDVAAAVLAALDRDGDATERFELAGPRHAHPRGDRRPGAARRSAAGARSCPCPSRSCAARCARSSCVAGPDRVRHRGRGRAAWTSR